MKTREIISDALDKLDVEGSPAQIAARLDLDCCVGIRSYSTCPIAEWLLVVTGLHVLVGPDFWVHEPTSLVGQLPRNVAAFVWGFDQRHYPQLDVSAV